MLSPELPSIFEPADAWHGAAHGWTTKLDGVPRRNCIQLLLHALGVGPVGTCVEKDASEYPDESLSPQEMLHPSEANNKPLEK